MENEIRFISDGNELCGLLEKESPKKGAIIAHPHPLHGGAMNNLVVGSTRQAYLDCGFTTLRFNFRGVGESHGQYDDGIGEQADILAAVSYLKNMGIAEIHLAGYSFGAWVIAKITQFDPIVKSIVMVSPPVASINYTGISDISCLDLVITGSKDEIAPPEIIEELLPIWNKRTRFEVIEGTNHFYGGRRKELETIIRSFIAGAG